MMLNQSVYLYSYVAINPYINTIIMLFTYVLFCKFNVLEYVTTYVTKLLDYLATYVYKY